MTFMGISLGAGPAEAGVRALQVKPTLLLVYIKPCAYFALSQVEIQLQA